MAQQQVPKLAEYIGLALKNDYFITILITSRTMGKFQSLNLPFGLGKTTLALWVSYLLNDKNWDKVFDVLCYYPNEVVKLMIPNVETGKLKRTCIVWDDVQFTCPASQGTPTAIRKLSGYLTTNRPECSVLVMTAPGFNDISFALRKLVCFEMIVFERGMYEVQQIVRHKNWKGKPTEDLEKLVFIEGQQESRAFLPLPNDIQLRYDKWRAEKKKPFADSLLGELDVWMKKKMEVQPIDIQVSEAARIMRSHVRE